MSDESNMIDMRYARAADYPPPCLMPKLTGVVVDGYWIDDHRYFFCASEVGDEGRSVSRPKIVDAAIGDIVPAIEPGVLASLLQAHNDEDTLDLSTAQYAMPSADMLVITTGTHIYHVAIDGSELVRTEPVDPIPALHSPDSKYACFLKDHAVWVKDRATGVARQLSPDGERYHGFGNAPEAGIAPVSGRKCPMPQGLWSANSEWFVTQRADERHLPEAGITEHVPEGGKRAVPHVFKVSGPDHDLVTFSYIAFHLPSGRTVDLSDRPGIYHVFSPFSGRLCWLVGEIFYFIEWDRLFLTISLNVVDLSNGAVRTILSETTESGWVDIHPSITGQPLTRVLGDAGAFIWWSQVDGSGHLYLHDLATGALKNRITEGPWTVREIVHVDEERHRIMFLASGFAEDADPGQRRLCAINFDGSGFETLVVAVGEDIGVKPDSVTGIDQLKPYRPSYAQMGASIDGHHIVANIGAIDRPTRSVLIEVGTGKQIVLAESNISSLWKAPKPQSFEVLASDGVTKLYGAMFFPADFDPEKSYPLVDYIYPGPQINWFVRRFPNFISLTLQAVVELGAVGIILETRGMPGRGRDFHQAGEGGLLEPQLSDHVAAMEQLCARHAYLDRDRVGMFGQSGGGFATARALFDYPEIFKVGVSVCGNHDNRNYISLWTDKYGAGPGAPQRDDQANAQHAHKLQGKLLLIHGDMDENVHPAHTMGVVDALIKANKDFDMLIVPGAGHGVMMETPYAYQKMLNFFARHLLGMEPPADFALTWTRADLMRIQQTMISEMV